MKKYLRFLFVAFLAMQGMNAMASDWVIDFNKMTVATSSRILYAVSPSLLARKQERISRAETSFIL